MTDLARTDAPERIWVDFAEYPSGAMVGYAYTSDLGDIPYILATPTAIAASPEMQALLAAETARADAAEALVKYGADTIATILLLDIAAALRDHERVFLTRDETSLGPRILEFAAAMRAGKGATP